MASAQEITARIERKTPDKNETFSKSGVKDFVPETPPEIVDVGGKPPQSRFRPRSSELNSYT